MDIFTEISLIIVLATAVAGIMHLLRQPIIIGHIITGLLVGPYFLNILKAEEVVNVFSELGIALLLFIVGLGLSPRLIKEVGLISIIAGTGQIIFTTIISFGIGILLGFDYITALYIAIALSFSSTIIVVKLLSDKHDIQKLYGKIALGILLVQDIVAAFILIGLPAFFQGQTILDAAVIILFKGVILTALAILISYFVLPKLSAFFARSQEFLFLFSVSWGLGLATLFHYFNFSIEIGALIAGISLSMSPYHLEISAKLKSLRDFFVVLFFIALGSKIIPGTLSELLIPIIILSSFVIIGKILIVMTFTGLLGYSKKTSFFAGTSLAQVSEFSMILVLLGAKLGLLSDETLSLLTFVGIITIGISTYLIIYAEKIYPYFVKPLSIFERSEIKSEKKKKYDIILFGHNRIGIDFIESFNKLNKKFLIVDFDPQMIKELGDKNIDCCYGDADDVELLDELNLAKIKMAVSTIPEFETNALLIEKIRKNNTKAIIIAISHNIKEAERLYKRGASYVILPHFLGGKYTANMITKFKMRRTEFAKEKKKHLNYLKQRKEMGHEHPVHEKYR